MDIIEEILIRLSLQINTRELKMSDVIIQICINGMNSHYWFLLIDKGHATIAHESPGEPNIVLTCNYDDFMYLANGELEPVKAFMSGRLVFKGEKTNALQLLGLFKST